MKYFRKKQFLSNKNKFNYLQITSKNNIFFLFFPNYNLKFTPKVNILPYSNAKFPFFPFSIKLNCLFSVSYVNTITNLSTQTATLRSPNPQCSSKTPYYYYQHYLIQVIS